METDDDLYGVVICNLLGLGLYSEVSHSDQVLLLHSDLGPEPEQLQSMVESLQAQARVGAGGKVCENAFSFSSDLELLAEVTRLLRPGTRGDTDHVAGCVSRPGPRHTWPLIMAELSVTSAPTLLTSHPNMTVTLAKLNMSQGQLSVVLCHSKQAQPG